MPDKQLRLLLAVFKKTLNFCKCSYGKHMSYQVFVGPVMLPVLQACRHFLFGASAYLVQDRTTTDFPWICGSEYKVYPGFQCKSTAKRHSSHLVGTHRKKVHVMHGKSCDFSRWTSTKYL